MPRTKALKTAFGAIGPRPSAAKSLMKAFVPTPMRGGWLFAIRLSKRNFQMTKSTMTRKHYLGDGAYVEIDHGMIKLTTSDGYSDTNTIYLDRFTFQERNGYVEEYMSEIS